MKKIKLFLVDDSNIIIKTLTDLFSENEEIEVIGSAGDGKEAIEKIPQNKPDVLILDINMPVMNGIEVVRYLSRNYPIPILIFSSYAHDGAKITNQALMEGALDFMQKPESVKDHEAIKDKLIEKIKIISRVKLIRTIDFSSRAKKAKKAVKKKKLEKKINKIIVIGVSTGGPKTLRYLFSRLTEKLTCPILVAQHMPKRFTKFLADELNQVSSYQIKEVEDNEKLENSIIYIGQGGSSFKIKPDLKFSIFQDNKTALPSVNTLFKSAAEAFGENVLGIVLTGMGDDGLKGAKKIKENGGRIIAQSKESSVIFGMPQAVINNDLADEVAQLEDIPDILIKYMK